MSLLRDIQAAVRDRQLDITLHAQQQMTSRRIKISEVREMLTASTTEVVEDYPEVPRGSSCLVYGQTATRILHIHISYPPEIVVITAYAPDPIKWELDFKTRR